MLVKAFGLLEATAGVPEGKALAELAAQVGLTKPTTHRILKMLSILGVVERLDGGIYRQTGRLRRLLVGPDDRVLIAAADPILRALYNHTQETVNLGVLRHGQILYLHVLESTRPLRRVATADTTDPFYCMALGRAIVSQLPVPQQRTLLGNTRLEARTPHTVVDREALLKILADVKRDGYAIEQDQTDLGVTCIGAAVFDPDAVRGAISLSIPTARATDAELVRLVDAVRSAADKLTDALQHQLTETCA